MWYISGNRDSEMIEDADSFIIDRKRPRQHLSFGFGLHRCVGNRLAEQQLRILWEEILKRFDKIEVMGNPGRINKSSQLSIWRRGTPKIAFVALDTSEEPIKQGSIVGVKGEKLEKNPLADKRVREALRLSLDTEAFAKRVFAGEVLATGQFFQPGDPGYDPSTRAWRSDIDRARRLVQESGWSGKFNLDLTVSSTLFQNAVASAEAIAQQWTRIGVTTRVVNVPYQTFLSRRVAGEIPVAIALFQNSWGTAELIYPTLLHSRNPQKNFGIYNYYRYSNSALDKVIEDASVTLNDERRKKLYQQANQIVIDDSAIIPLWLPIQTIASKKGIVVQPRADGELYPTSIRSSP